MEAEPVRIGYDDLLEHAQWIRGLARGLLEDPSAVDDVIQETWLAALMRRPSRERPLRPWLSRVLRNQVALLRRRRARIARWAESTEVPALPSADELVIRAEMQRAVVGAVLQLEEPYRSVVLLRYYEGHSAVEIARRRRGSAATVRTQLHRARAKLHTILDENLEGGRRRWMPALAPIAFDDEWERSVSTGIEVSVWKTASLLLAVTSLIGLVWLARANGEHVLQGVHAAGVQDKRSPADRPIVRGRSHERARPGESPQPASVRTPVRVLAPTTGPLVGIVVDEQTGEPLPHFELELASERTDAIRVMTGADGRFRTELELPAENYRIVLIDDQRLRGQDVTIHGGERVRAFTPELELTLQPGANAIVSSPAGPTYFLRMELPDGLAFDRLVAHVRSPSLFETRAWALHVAPVRPPVDDSYPWVRFGNLYTRFLSSEPPWRLEISSADGFWSGSAEVSSIVGVTHDPVELTLVHCGRVEGVAADLSGPVQRDLVVELRSRRDPAEALECATDEKGRFRFDRVEPGRYTLLTDSPRHRETSVSLTVSPAEITRSDLMLATLDSIGAGGPIRGRLTSVSGNYDAPVILVLSPRAAERDGFYASAAWQDDDGTTIARFAFDDVPAGEYDLRIVACRDQFRWSPEPQPLVPPIEDLTFECQDAGPRADLGFRVIDGATGVAVERPTIVYASGSGVRMSLARGSPELSRDDPRSGAELWGVSSQGLTWTYVTGPNPIKRFPLGAELHWAIFADGYRPAYGDEASFVGDGGERMAVVALERGWGARLRILVHPAAADSASRALEGVAILADGVVVARSAADGVAELSLEREPERLSVRYVDWRIVAGDLDAESGRLSGKRLLYEISMSPLR